MFSTTCQVSLLELPLAFYCGSGLLTTFRMLLTCPVQRLGAVGSTQTHLLPSNQLVD